MPQFHPDFTPELSPKQMLELGVFGGCYYSGIENDFPKSWFTNAKLSLDGKKHNELNYFKIGASQPLAVWKKKGWLHPDDPHGWFEWYCKYYLGRRHPDDERQIKRWRAMKRHVMQVVKNCRKGDMRCRPRQRQALLHWAYDSRKL